MLEKPVQCGCSENLQFLISHVREMAEAAITARIEPARSYCTHSEGKKGTLPLPGSFISLLSNLELSII